MIRSRIHLLAIVGCIVLVGPVPAVTAQPGPDGGGEADTAAAFARALQRFMGAAGQLATPVALPDELPADQVDAFRASVHAARLDAAAAAGAECVAHAGFASASLDDRQEVRLMLAQVELARGRHAAALKLVADHQSACAPPAEGTADGGATDWARASRRQYIDGLAVSIRIRLARYADGDGPAEFIAADIAAARAARAELESLDSTLAARLMADLFPPFVPGDAAPSFVARLPTSAPAATDSLADDLRERGFSERAVRDASHGMFTSDGLRGAVVVVVFWQRIVPASEQLARELCGLPATHPGKPLLVLGVNIDSSPDMLRAAMSKPPESTPDAPPLHAPQIQEGPLLAGDHTDPLTRLRVCFACRRAPWVVLIGPDGRVQATSASAALAGARIKRHVAELLDQK
ncbi:MAG: TlpA family protein disulfide reductase [Planctomycetota bacterium]